MQKLVELIPALTTSEGTLSRAQAMVEKILGKHAIRAQDRSGFVVNALLIPYLLSAIRMFESGIASARTSTTAWSWAAPTRWGR